MAGGISKAGARGRRGHACAQPNRSDPSCGSLNPRSPAAAALASRLTQQHREEEDAQQVDAVHHQPPLRALLVDGVRAWHVVEHRVGLQAGAVVGVAGSEGVREGWAGLERAGRAQVRGAWFGRLRMPRWPDADVAPAANTRASSPGQGPSLPPTLYAALFMSVSVALLYR